MEEDEDFQKEKIIQGLQKLGFTINDSKVYFALLNLGKSNPASIAELSGVDRARVYDSLKRLVKKNIVEEEPVKRAPSYKAKDPERVLTNIKHRYNKKIQLADNIELLLESYEMPNKEPAVWSLDGSKRITRAIDTLIENAESKISIILSPDISGVEQNLSDLVRSLINKKENNEEIQLDLAFNVSESHTLTVKRLLNADIEVYHWASGGILPFGLYLSDKSFVLTILSEVKGIPEYNFGVLMENATPGMKNGFNHLIQWCYANICKRVAVKKVKKNDKK